MSTNTAAPPGPPPLPDPKVRAHIKTFDELDFEVFSRQQWDQIDRSHADEVVVHWPDGHQTRGVGTHVSDLRDMFSYAPDTRISAHPVKFGQGDWTCVIGVYEGTFTQPMEVNGKVIQPTGKPFKLLMCTVAHWKDGVMDEEFLFWDNQAFLRQVGVA